MNKLKRENKLPKGGLFFYCPEEEDGTANMVLKGGIESIDRKRMRGEGY